MPKPTNLYGKCKQICEYISYIYSVPTVGLRIFAGYGPGEDHKGRIASVVTLFLNSVLKEDISPNNIWERGVKEEISFT